MQKLSGRAASMARREAQVSGKNVLSARSNTSAPAVSSTPPAAAAIVKRPATVTTSTGRAASQARRRAMSKQGKSGVASTDRQRMADTMRNARNQAQQKKDCGCGCNGEGDCAKNVPSSSASSRVLPKFGSNRRSQEPKKVTPSSAGRINSRLRREMLAKHGKSGNDVFRKGLSSAQMVKHQNPDISGRQLARSIRAQRSATGAQGATAPAPVGRKRPRPETGVTGTKVAHSEKTTGDEIGLCRSVTGTDYMSSEVFTDFCQADSPKVLPSVPAKVQTTETLSGSTVTGGGRVGRSERVTGDERGSCRNVTGDEYVGREQYDNFCQSKPEPGSAKVSHSQTTRGLIVSGSKPARSRSVTGDEAGTCKAVTGTPYAGVEQTQDYCMPQEVKVIQARTFLPKSNTGRDISGTQPGLSGLTGAEKGSCQSVSGTAYLADHEQVSVCGTAPAQIGDSDFPQPLEGAPWGSFSIATPNHASEIATPNYASEIATSNHVSEASVVASGVTGTSYEQGRISGTFSLGEGKVTGTEQFRFGGRRNESPVAVPGVPVDKVKEAKVSRVTGEGLSTGLTVTGNDWDRGEHVTGTEGRSATRRNLTIRGPVNAMPDVVPKRNEEVPPSDSKVTGGSGNTEKGAMITVSGGARG
ncbi:MAG: CsoS2 family carboxysome shell protein [Gammaproteobacteria bacterium]|nr:CsoS2 family carboxysome shell protein [Gammaproteobacteria bacterium]